MNRRGDAAGACLQGLGAADLTAVRVVTAALFDMFCGLKGRTRSPRRRKARHRPAARSDLPTSEPVPWSISAGGRAEISSAYGH